MAKYNKPSAAWINLWVLLGLSAIPYVTLAAQVSSKSMAQVSQLDQGLAAQQAVLLQFARCIGQSSNRKQLKRSMQDKDSGVARRIQNRCLSPQDRQILTRAPANTSDNGDSSGYFQSMSYGLGPSAAVYYGAGVDGGWIWNFNGDGPTRPYLTGSTGKGLQANLGADPVIIGVYRSGVAPGNSKSTVVIGSVEVGVGVTAGLIYKRDTIHYSNEDFQGFMVAVGAGAGFNVGSEYKTRTRIFRVACRDVKVEATNETGKQVKVIDIDYHDYTKGKWRSKIIPNKKLASGKVYKKTFKKLSKVGGEQTQIRVEYRTLIKDGFFKKWSEVKRDWSSKGYCDKGATFAVTLD